MPNVLKGEGFGDWFEGVSETVSQLVTIDPADVDQLQDLLMEVLDAESRTSISTAEVVEIFEKCWTSLKEARNGTTSPKEKAMIYPWIERVDKWRGEYLHNLQFEGRCRNRMRFGISASA